MKKTKLIAIIIVIILLILLVIPMAITIIAYNANFNIRVATTISPDAIQFEDLELTRTPIEFTSNNNQILRGYIYSNTEDISNKKALIVFSHGYLGTHTDYLDQINYFAQNNYLVLGYDNTGSGMSDGETLIGLAQSPLDLDAALTFAENNEDLSKYKILLYGHSWGGYAVAAVLNYGHDVTAIVSRSGFSNSRDMLVEYGSNLYGDFIQILSPYAYIYEKIKFGDAVDLNGIKGINNAPNTQILLLHSEDDPVISLKNSLLIHKDEYTNPERIHTIQYKDKGHDVVQLNPSDETSSELDMNVMHSILDFYEEVIV